MARSYECALKQRAPDRWIAYKREEPLRPSGATWHRYRPAHAMDYRMHTAPIPDPVADPTRDPEGEPAVPPAPGHHNDEPQRPEGPPDKNPSLM